MILGAPVVRLARYQLDALARAVKAGALDPAHPDHQDMRELLPLFARATAVSVRIDVAPPRHVRGVDQS